MADCGAGCGRPGSFDVALYDANDGPGDPVRVSFLEPGSDVKGVYTDANQICWNKAELSCAQADDADDQAIDN